MIDPDLESKHLPGGHVIYNFDKGFRFIHGNAFSFPYRCAVVEKFTIDVLYIFMANLKRIGMVGNESLEMFTR